MKELIHTREFKGNASSRLSSGVKLTHFQPMFHLNTPPKHQKTSGFLMSLGGIVVGHCLKMG